MIKLLRRRGAAAVAGLFIFAAGSQAAVAAPIAGLAPIVTMPAAATLSKAAAATTQPANANPVGTTMAAASAATQAASGFSAAFLPAMAREAAWLHRSGWPLYALVDRYSASANVPLTEQAHCIAVAVYHEARGESLEGQLAVARVIMNRAASGKYPASWCGTVKQPWQFSFVRGGRFPYTDTNCDAWRKAVAVTRLAITNVVPSVPTDVLWYHADYVSPSWGKRLERVDKIGTHIFYRA